LGGLKGLMEHPLWGGDDVICLLSCFLLWPLGSSLYDYDMITLMQTEKSEDRHGIYDVFTTSPPLSETCTASEHQVGSDSADSYSFVLVTHMMSSMTSLLLTLTQTCACDLI
jgi:hypothetical protein